MKYSQLLGILCCIALCIICFIPWTFIVSKQLSITGMHTTGTSFGKPGMTNIVFSVVLILFFAIPKIWSKRTNIFVAALNIAWSFRSYLLVTGCFGGECPQKELGIYLLLFLSFAILIMTFLPKIAISDNDLLK